MSAELHPCETSGGVAYFWSADQINMCVYDYDTRIVMLTHKYFHLHLQQLCQEIGNA